jgi:hypothetical protein
MSTRYHVADESYRIGGDLLCRDRLEIQGRAPEWKWEDAQEGFDGDVICLFDSLEEAQDFRAEWCPNGIILGIDLPADPDELMEYGMAYRRVAEGYIAICDRIPAEYIKEA